MKKSTVFLFAAVAVLAVAAMPLYISFYLSPALTNFVQDNVEMEAMRVARHLAAMFVPDGRSIDKESLTPEFHYMADQVLDQFTLKKVKLFTASGEIIYSSEKADIGEINHKSYFHNIVAKGNNYSKLVVKDHESLEGKIMHAHVVETYVPIFQKGNFVGAFEIYYDITARQENLEKFIHGLYAGLAGMVVILVGGVVLSLRRALISVAEHQRIEKELQKNREQFDESVAKRTAELEEKIARTKTMRGVLSLCGSCGKVKGENGIWHDLVPYIASHTEAECTSDLCLECEKRIHDNIRINTSASSSIN